MSPLNKIKKKLVKKLCICKQKSNTFVSKNNCVCAVQVGKKRALEEKRKEPVQCKWEKKSPRWKNKKKALDEKKKG